ncbi:MAG TPA: pitrilysin family protein [Candidatus Polarisedimenticolaceae bacterium]|nr:pitrilysin family protein [Candidatus Polarisedimenticolaceae bacterium]
MTAAALLLAAAAVPMLDTHLANGLRVTILPDPGMTVVATQVWYHVGSADEDPGSRGLAHLFEHLMFGPTETREAREYSAFHTRHGGEENAFTDTDETVYVSEIAPPHHLGVLAREADRMRHLVLDAAALDNERKIVTEELRLRTENDPMGRLLTAAQVALLAGHPYGHEVAGTHEDLEAASLSAVRAFYARWYVPANAQVVVVGPVDAQETLATIRSEFGPIPAAGPPERHPIPAVTAHRFPARLTLREDIPPVEVALLGFPLPPPGAPDADAIEVLLEMLTARQVDPVREELVVRRKRGIEAGAQGMVFRQGGALVFYVASLPYRRQETAFRDLEEARRTLDGGAWLSPEGLRAAQRSLLRKAADRRYRAARMADALGRETWFRGDPAAALDEEHRVAAVTLADVRVAWERWVMRREPVRLYVEPEHVPWYVTAFGWLAPLFL